MFNAVVAQPFYYLGELRLPLGSTGEIGSANYYVAVSLLDRSLWLVYNAWTVKEGDREDYENPNDPDLELLPPGPFRPDWDPSWAELPGLTGRTLMAKVADDVRTWDFGANPDVEMRLEQAWTSDLVVPSFVCALISPDGKRVVSPRA